MGKETEYKLEVGDLQLLDCILCSEPVASRMQAPFAYIRMQTTYYDTEDGLLENNRWMLRLRTENERSVVPEFRWPAGYPLRPAAVSQ